MFGIRNNMTMEIKRKPKEPTLSMEIDPEEQDDGMNKPFTYSSSLNSFMSFPNKANNNTEEFMVVRNHRLIMAHHPNANPNDDIEEHYEPASLCWKPMTESFEMTSNKDSEIDSNNYSQQQHQQHNFQTPHLPMFMKQWGMEEEKFQWMIEEGSCSLGGEHQLMEMVQMMDWKAHQV
ncbi:hypothetical protein C9374_004023 [Naegleria lovaniensis]|uniref:Uncharacterized protein n=1 Tax=Naegleria lovaniensis TaxID=51637 RepID=A0AA88H138_NAELO|nr:uncharacterized protein C9374_004023 [Naegleria lovaniensis]KAG2394259.1 hypothetical protein C9374_004023 [Naegleria lovaniensis]